MMRYLFLIITLCVCSCGLRPYSEFNTNSHILTQISLGTIKGEQQHLIKNYLLNALNIYDQHNEIKYLLDVTVISQSNDSVVQKDSTVLEKTITINAAYVLKAKNNLTPLTQGTITLKSNFTSTASPYGSFVQEKKSYADALKLTVSDIKRNLIIYFAKNSKDKNENSH